MRSCYTILLTGDDSNGYSNFRRFNEISEIIRESCIIFLSFVDYHIIIYFMQHCRALTASDLRVMQFTTSDYDHNHFGRSNEIICNETRKIV